MLRLVALLPPEEGALVASVLESIALERSQQPAQAAGEALAKGREAPEVPDPAEDPWAARRADALVAVCERAAGVAASELEGAPGRTRVVVHVDASLLSGKAEGCRCTLEDGRALPPSVAEWLACDAEVVELWEREGLPIDLGRSRRTVSPRLRTDLNARDRGCCFPGCPVPGRRTHAHHLQHWLKGGRTDLSNLVSLCGFHHRRLHEGAYTIGDQRDGSLSFAARNGKPIKAQSQRLDCASAGAPHLRPGAERSPSRSADNGTGEDRRDYPEPSQRRADSAPPDGGRDRRPTLRVRASSRPWRPRSGWAPSP